MSVGLSLKLWVITEDDKDVLRLCSLRMLLNELVKEGGPLYRLASRALGIYLARGDDPNQPFLDPTQRGLIWMRS